MSNKEELRAALGPGLDRVKAVVGPGYSRILGDELRAYTDGNYICIERGCPRDCKVEVARYSDGDIKIAGRNHIPTLEELKEVVYCAAEVVEKIPKEEAEEKRIEEIAELEKKLARLRGEG